MRGKGDYESTALTAELRARTRSKALHFNNFPHALSIVSVFLGQKKGICVVFAVLAASTPSLSSLLRAHQGILSLEPHLRIRPCPDTMMYVGAALVCAWAYGVLTRLETCWKSRSFCMVTVRCLATAIAFAEECRNIHGEQL